MYTMAKFDEITQNNLNYFNTEDDFVFTTDENNKFVGGGFKIDSFFLDNNMSPMTTYNSPDANIDSKIGGKVSSPFENLAVPAGLFYINQKVPKRKDEDPDDKDHYKQHNMAPDDLIDKLFGLVEMDKKRKRKTRRQTNILTKNKRTRRNS